MDRSIQPAAGSYLPTLPRLCRPLVPPRVSWPSAVPKLDTGYCARLAVGSACCQGQRPPPRRGFQGLNLSKRSLTQHHASTPNRNHRTRCRAYHELSKPTCAGRTPTRPSVTRLSYPASLTGSPVRSQRVQISPRRPVPFRTPQQPTCGACVRPFRAARREDLPPFTRTRDIEPLPARARFLVAQHSRRCAPLSHVAGIGSKAAFQPPAPVGSARALLEARSSSNTPAAIGDRSELALRGLGRPGTALGWRPQQ